MVNTAANIDAEASLLNTSNIVESEINTALNMDADIYWEMITEIGAPIVAAMSDSDTQKRDQIKKEVLNK